VANQWLRLWHDMPTDPKWRTIAKASGQRIGDVMAVYCHLLVCASNATERGRTQSFCSEDVASSLDMETEQVQQIIDAMQGRVLESDTLMGWEKRQVAREDGASERAKAWREAKKQAKTPEPNATERNRTQAERKQTPDKIRLDKDKNTNTVDQPDGFDTFWSAYPKKVGKPAALKAFRSAKINGHLPEVLADLEDKAGSEAWTKAGGQFVPNPATYLNQRRWEDEKPHSPDIFAGAI